MQLTVSGSDVVPLVSAGRSEAGLKARAKWLINGCPRPRLSSPASVSAICVMHDV